MEEQLVRFIESLQSNDRLADMDEASTKQAIVIKMLSLLGWDIFDVDEVKPDLAVKSHTVDFSLRSNKADAVFINVKKVNAALDKHQKQILGCARAEGVKLSILTNGMAWWFYLSLQEGALEQKKFCSIDLLKQNPKDSAPILFSLLEKDSITSGKSLQMAESMQKMRHNRNVEKYLAKSWNKLLSKPPEALVNLLNESVEKLTGYKADKKAIVKYLVGCSRPEPAEEIIDLKEQVASKEPIVSTEPIVSDEPIDLKEPVTSKEPVAPPSTTYEGKSISSYTFKGGTFNVDSWEQLLVNLCKMLSLEYNMDIEKLLWHSVEGKFLFRENADELRLGLNIIGTNLYVETALGPDFTVRVAHSVLEVFGYSSDDLKIATE
jgi:hypothetical protein